jgi:hypothetical protein
MMLEVSLDTLTRCKITAHQFLVTKLLHEKKFEKLEEYLTLTDSLQNLTNDLNHLASIEFINWDVNDVSKDFKNIKILPTFIKQVSNGSLFEELYDSYPIKVIRDGGIPDYLRTERYNSRRLYDMIVARNQSKHEHILKCLQYEVNHRESQGSMRYMKRMYKWIQDQEWRSFEERVGDTENVQTGKEVKYGTELE